MKNSVEQIKNRNSVASSLAKLVFVQPTVAMVKHTGGEVYDNYVKRHLNINPDFKEASFIIRITYHESLGLIIKSYYCFLKNGTCKKIYYENAEKTVFEFESWAAGYENTFFEF